MTIRTDTPGKLMLCGEWAVLEMDVPCVVMAIDKKVSVKLDSAQTISIHAPDLKVEKKEGTFDGHLFEWNTSLSDSEKEKLLIAKHAVETALKYVSQKGKTPLNFSIVTSSEDCVVNLPNKQVAKVGFGSSAAACVGIVKAVLEFHGIDAKSPHGKELVFKLACMAHFEAQGKVGSSFDVAASTYGGMLKYKRFDPTWLAAQSAAKKNTAQIAQAAWPSLQLEPLEVPKNFRLLLGYTGPDSSTKEMIRKMDQIKVEKKEEYWKIVHEIKKIVEALVPALKKNDSEKILALIQKNRAALGRLSDLSELNLETPKLALLSDISEKNRGAGKLSGSGGGGVGIAVCFDPKIEEKILLEWKQAGIEPVDAKIAKRID